VTAAGCEQNFTDALSGARTERQGLTKAVDYVRSVDTLVAWLASLVISLFAAFRGGSCDSVGVYPCPKALVEPGPRENGLALSEVNV
jgi:hypothetical protein